MRRASATAVSATTQSTVNLRDQRPLGRTAFLRGVAASKSVRESGKSSRIFRQYLFISLNSESRKRMSNKILVFCSVPTSECASLIANTVVQEELAACVTVLPGLSSVYRWRGEVESATEQLLLIKTSEPLFDKLRARILSLHPYEVPEVIATPITAGHAPYLEWIDQSTLGL